MRSAGAPIWPRRRVSSTPCARARRIRWAEKRNLTLGSVTGADLGAYREELAEEKSEHEAAVYLSPVRRMFGELVRAGVLAADPCRRGQPNGRSTAADPDATSRLVPLSELKRIVLEVGEEDGWQEGDEVQAGLILLAPLSLDTMDPAALSSFTGVPEAKVVEFARRLVANGIWRPDGKIGELVDKEREGIDGLGFMLDVWVAIGDLERTTLPPDEDEDGASRIGGERSSNDEGGCR